MTDMIRVLRLDASANPGDSTSRELGDRLLERLRLAATDIELRRRDLNQDPMFIDGDWIAANLTNDGRRDADQRQCLASSDRLIEELRWADHIVLTTPMYNFGVPATLKAWIDLVCRAGETFRYTENGPVGMLEGKSADIVITTGGAPLGSPVDFVSGYLRQIMSFIGIEQVRIFGADRMNVDAAASLAAAIEHIDRAFAVRDTREVA